MNITRISVQKIDVMFKDLQFTTDYKNILRKCDVLSIKIKENETIVTITAIANLDNGFYNQIKTVTKNGKIYNAQRYHYKYIPIVQDMIFEYYKENKQIPWLNKKEK